jgi:methyl-accepting chemotaxis protein
MIQTFISWIAPKDIDPQMLRITENYLAGLLILFLVFFLWIVGRVSIRWIQLIVTHRKIRNFKKKSQDLKSIRSYLKDNLFKKKSWAKDGFEAFCVAWDESRPRNEDKAIMPVRLREFLTPEIVLDGVRNRRLAEALPGIFVALGIFGTFLGLVLGLQGLEFGKLDTLQDGVGQLISGLSLAFLTSLAGIALSIIFSFFYRMAISRLERSFLALDTILCRFYPYNSQERYVRRHYELQAGIKQGLQTLATDVATQITGTISSKLGDALDDHFLPVMKDFHVWMQAYMEDNKNQQKELSNEFNQNLVKLSKIISAHFESSQNKQSEAMGKVLEQYSETLTVTFQNQFEAMGKIIEETTKSQHEIKQQLVGFSEILQSQLQSQGEMIEKTNRAGEILGQSLDSLESIAQKLKASADDISSAAELLERSAVSAKEGQETLNQTMLTQVDAMTRTREELDRAWETITENTGYLVSQISQTVEELTTGVSKNLIKALDSFDGKVAEVVERFSGTLFEAGETISEMPRLVVTLNDSLDSINKGIIDQKDILNDIRETSKGMVAENIQKAYDASKDLGTCTESMADTASTLHQFIESFNDNIKATVESFANKNQQSIEELGNMIGRLTEELQKSHKLMGEENPMTRALEKLNENSKAKSNGDGLAEQMAAVCTQLEKMTINISKFSGNSSNGFDPDIIKRITDIDKHVAGLSNGMMDQVLPRADNLKSAIDSMSKSLNGLRVELQKDPETSKISRFFRKGR